MLVILVIVAVPCTLLILGSLLGTHTTYCPLKHKISDTSACVILDKQLNRILIQHADLDTNEYYLEILDNDASERYKMPKTIYQLAPKGYTAMLTPTHIEITIKNGSKITMEQR